MKNYTLVKKIVPIEGYLKLRQATLGKRTKEDATIGLKNTWYGVHVLCDDVIVGMGRIVTDGALEFVIADMAVLPEFQGDGIGGMIMQALTIYYDENAPKDAFMYLIAKGNAKYLYQKYDFVADPEFSAMLRVKDR